MSAAELHRLTPIKVGPPRDLSNGGRMWPVVIQEDQPSGEISTFSEGAARDLQAHVGQAIDVELERGKDFHSLPQWKVLKTPAWSRGQGGRGGGGGVGRTMEERAEDLRAAALQAASRLAAAGLLDAGSAESIEAATIRAASWLLVWLRGELRAEDPAIEVPSAGERQSDDDGHAHSWVGVEGKPWRRCLSCGVTARVEATA
jgi:hypothetical protein